MRESVLSCCLFAMKTFNNSFVDTMKMDLSLFLELISVYQKVNSVPDEKEIVSIKDILSL